MDGWISGKTNESLPAALAKNTGRPYESALKLISAEGMNSIFRDEFMKKLHEEFPHYGWQNNKGYGTAEHRIAIKEFGLCTYHRKSFRLLPEQSHLL